MRELQCRLKECTIHYETRGDGKPFIMLHGAGPDRRSMIGCMEPIMRKRKDWLRVYPDLPGMGKTPAEEWITNSDQMLEIIMNFINAVIPDQHFLLAGDSYGGYLACGIVYHATEKVDGLLLMGPVTIADHAKRTLPKHVTLAKSDALPSDLYPEETKMFEPFAVVETPKIFERTRKEILPGLKIADMKFLDRLQARGYAFTFDPDSPPVRFVRPTLILVGRQDSMVGYHDSMRILNNYPRATLAVLDRAGHNLQIEQERLFNCLVNEWLDRVEETKATALQKQGGQKL
jgi:pimeloyl-ACP methyl ester carboxylesterase